MSASLIESFQDKVDALRGNMGVLFNLRAIILDYALTDHETGKRTIPRLDRYGYTDTQQVLLQDDIYHASSDISSQIWSI